MARRLFRVRLLPPMLVIMTLVSACSGLPFAILASKATSVPVTATAQAVSVPNTPPAIVAFSPFAGQKITPDNAVIEPRFDRAMDRATVEAAPRLSLEVDGEMSWIDESTLQFHPKASAPETRYRMGLDVTALATAGVALGRSFTFAFSTLGPLQVADLCPAPDAAGLGGNFPLAITFNRLIVLLNCVGKLANAASGCPGLVIALVP